MEAPVVSVLVVDDFAQWRLFVRKALREYSRLQWVGEAADGLEAVRLAKELKPGLVLLDIGLPGLNGIEVARRIQKLSPQSKILFVSQEASPDLVREALRLGVAGYLVKSDAARELSIAVDVVLRGETFVGMRFAGQDFAAIPRHTGYFYSNDRSLLDQLTRFIANALQAGNAAVVVATETHREGLFQGLQAHGLDFRRAMEQGRFIALDANEILSTIMVNGTPDSDLFVKSLGDLVARASEASVEKNSRVAMFGELANLLCEQGNGTAAVQLETIANQMVQTCSVDILCGYSEEHIQDVTRSQLEALRKNHLCVSGL